MLPHLKRLAFTLLLLACSLNPQSVALSLPAAPSGNPVWRDTGIEVVPPRGAACIAPDEANVLLISDEDQGTRAVNWQTGQQSVVNTRSFDLCAPSGWLYGVRGGTSPAYRFSLHDPTIQFLDHPPDYWAADGTLQVYSFQASIKVPSASQLWASADGGLTWEHRDPPFIKNMVSLMVAPTDGRLLYALTLNETPPAPGEFNYRIYVSTDAGQTWAGRSGPVTVSGQLGPIFENLYLAPVGGPTSSVDLLQLQIYYGSAGKCASRSETRLSDDGGRSFRSIGISDESISWDLVQTQEGILRLERHLAGCGMRSWGLSLSTDVGRTWQPLPPPPPPLSGVSNYAYIYTAPAAPANVFLYGNGYDYGTGQRDPYLYSSDGGHTWQPLENGEDFRYYISPYLPVTLLNLRGGGGVIGTPLPSTPGVPPAPPIIQPGRLYALDLPDAGTHQPAPAPPSGAPGSTYFAQTGHNLPSVFKAYWEAHGGLAQFGYPRTEAFREANPADGKVYLVQYFERNRFEYHPEYAGSPHEIELGLLGNEQTAARRATGEAPFAPVTDPQQPNVTYFAPTGHTLRGPFQAYWTAHGGLDLYGYPISEEFQEVNPDDGQTYTVQYFERNRFEYHPAFAGSPYEVELGLLGNTLLQLKGWQ